MYFSIGKIKHDFNKDSTIDANDLIWEKIRLWQDKNSDGYSQNGELKPPEDYKITAIHLSASNFLYPLDKNQRISKTAKFSRAFYNSGTVVSNVYNVMPLFDNTNSRYNKDYELDVRALFLPTLRGFGELPDLHIAISNDPALLKMVKELAIMDFKSMFSLDTNLEEKFENLLFQWANVSEIPADSRGPNIDARRLAFTEKLMGDQFKQAKTKMQNPNPGAAKLLKEAYLNAYNTQFSQFFLQISARNLYENVQYDPNLGTMTGTPKLNHETIAKIKTQLAEYKPKKAAFIWKRCLRILNYYGAFDKISDEDKQLLIRTTNELTPKTSLDEILKEIESTTGVEGPPKSLLEKLAIRSNLEFKRIKNAINL